MTEIKCIRQIELSAMADTVHIDSRIRCRPVMESVCVTLSKAALSANHVYPYKQKETNLQPTATKFEVQK